MLTALRVVAAYRAKHGITADTPMGPTPDIGSDAEREHEYQQAQQVYQHAIRALTQPPDTEQSPNWVIARRESPGPSSLASHVLHALCHILESL